MNKQSKDSCLHRFIQEPNVPLPAQFEFPHQYTPNVWSKFAAAQIQTIIPKSFKHDFSSSGKMFGVLVVKKEKKIGFLAAFSGKIDNSTQFKDLVPPIYDTLNTEAFFKQGEQELNELTRRINDLTNGESLSTIQQEKSNYELDAQEQITLLKNAIKAKKDLRDTIRNSSDLTAELEAQLANESKKEQLILKKLKKEFQATLEALNAKISLIQDEITALKEKRTNQSIALQQELFKSYRLLNFKGETSTVLEVFKAFNGDIPPAGSGECALPKMLHYAAKHGMTPISFAEFWWGRSPAGEIRKHGHFYPACRAKCEPILAFMLTGIDCKTNPVLENVVKEPISIIFEDEWMIVINKPSGMLSVPGRSDIDSAEDRLKIMFPNQAFIRAVHRLDMGTSGILIFAKDLKTYSLLQSQFAKQKVIKTYEAILEGTVKDDEGIIDLPLRLDLNHRPYQMVDFENGKKAITRYKVLQRENKRTKIEFYPKTGRTHQLRVHAAHPMGLNCPIVGDELYGAARERLLLHATITELIHPQTKETITLRSKFDC